MFEDLPLCAQQKKVAFACPFRDSEVKFIFTLFNMGFVGLRKPEETANIMLPNLQHCVKSVRIRSYSGQHFRAFGLNKERYRIQSECGKMRTRITPNTDTFYAVQGFLKERIFTETSLYN